MNKTVRQMISEVLRDRMLTAKDISREVGIKEKEVLEHLPHVARSLGHKGPHEGGREEKLVTEPSECLGCGFVFRKRARLKTPGKCPVCRSEEITETRYGIKGG
ncbi:MAG TPA: transcriptional regulator [Thermodesulfobacteriota bacterium]|nr:transcriptional regulator [Thermodesulfobacteriota bacterium]